MIKENGELRLLFPTEAYSMRTDSPDIRRIIHSGPPCLESKSYSLNMDYYIQRKNNDNNYSISTPHTHDIS